MKVPPMTIESHVLDCPACGMAIHAQIEVKVSLAAKERVGNTVPVEASTTMQRFNIKHHCLGPVLPSDNAAHAELVAAARGEVVPLLGDRKRALRDVGADDCLTNHQWAEQRGLKPDPRPRQSAIEAPSGDEQAEEEPGAGGYCAADSFTACGLADECPPFQCREDA